MVINHPLSASFIYYDPWHPPCSIYVPDSLFPQSLSKLYFGFVDFEKAFDKVPREVTRCAMCKLGVEEWLPFPPPKQQHQSIEGRTEPNMMDMNSVDKLSVPSSVRSRAAAGDCR